MTPPALTLAVGGRPKGASSWGCGETHCEAPSLQGPWCSKWHQSHDCCSTKDRSEVYVVEQRCSYRCVPFLDVCVTSEFFCDDVRPKWPFGTLSLAHDSRRTLMFGSRKCSTGIPHSQGSGAWRLEERISLLAQQVTTMMADVTTLQPELAGSGAQLQSSWWGWWRTIQGSRGSLTRRKSQPLSSVAFVNQEPFPVQTCTAFSLSRALLVLLCPSVHNPIL